MVVGVKSIQTVKTFFNKGGIMIFFFLVHDEGYKSREVLFRRGLSKQVIEDIYW